MSEIQVFEELPPRGSTQPGVVHDPYSEHRLRAREVAPGWVVLPTEYKHARSASSSASIISKNRGMTGRWAGFRAVSRKIDDKYRVLIQWKGEE